MNTLEHASLVAVGAHQLLWSDLDHSIRRMSRDGGPATTIETGHSPAGLAFSDGSFFWTRRETGEIRALEAYATTAVTLGTVSGEPYALAAPSGDAFVYVSTRQGEEVLQIPRTGGAPVVLASQQPDLRFIAADADWLVWTLSPVIAPEGGVRKFERATGAISVIGEGLPGPLMVTIGGKFVYWAQHATIAGSLMRAPLTGGPLEAVASMPGVLDVTSDGDRVFWTSDDSIWAIPVAGGETVPLAIGLSKPIAIVADDLWVYWVTDDIGEILKVAK